MAEQYATPLRLVTPYMEGQAVKDAQWLMAGHNRFSGLATYKDGKIDGQYGPLTAQATRRTKYWLGYPDSSIDNVFGQRLYEYLRKEQWRALPEDYQTRRKARLATQTSGIRAFRLAETYIDYKEQYKNLTKFGEWYGWNGVPWCAIFLSYVFSHTGSPIKYAWVGNWYYDAIQNKNRLRIIHSPTRGDIVGYNLPGGEVFDHIALFDQWVNKSDGAFRDLGGNTGPSNISNGGMVLKQTRNISLVKFFARMG